MFSELSRFEDDENSNIIKISRDYVRGRHIYGTILHANSDYIGVARINREMRQFDGLVVIRTRDISGISWGSEACVSLEKSIPINKKSLKHRYETFPYIDFRKMVTETPRNMLPFMLRREDLGDGLDVCISATLSDDCRHLKCDSISPEGNCDGQFVIASKDITCMEFDTRYARDMGILAGLHFES